MSFLHRGRKYKPGHKWSRAQLLVLALEKLLYYIKMKVYGDEKANPENDPHVNHRWNAVLYWKNPGPTLCWTITTSGPRLP